TVAVRITAASPNASQMFPVMFVIRERMDVLSWQIPLVLRDIYEYTNVSRTLCPVFVSTDLYRVSTEMFTVGISSQSNIPMSFTLMAEILQDFTIQDSKTVVVSASNPVYYMYTFPQGVDSVLIRATSKDKTCAVLSIQDIKCPVFDLDTDVKYQGKYQTMTTQGAITVTRENYPRGRLYIVLVMLPDRSECDQTAIQTILPAGQTQAQKQIAITVKKTIPTSQYYKAVLAAIGVFVSFYVAALIIGIFYHGCQRGWGIIPSDLPRAGNENSELLESPVMASGYGAIQPQVTGADSPGSSRGGVEANRDNESVSSLNSDEYDKVDDADQDKNIFRTKTQMFVCDLARKSAHKRDKNYNLYLKSLLTIAIFYGLPVIQLVMTYQKVLNFTGNQDICYYNFVCMHPLGQVSAFNNIFSNIGYMMLGILFLILVYRREYLHRKAVQKSNDQQKLYGIPQHFGLFYAMGLALCIEGIMSACYHVCPTVSNFQFDTSFMYIMACLCILKIYQNRHPDISAKAHSSYLVMAAIIIIAVIGVVYGNNIFWILFAIAYMFVSLLLSVHIYYMGRWRVDRNLCHRLWLLLISDWIKCSRPVYMNRLILLIIGNIVNFGIAIYGIVKSGGKDFASYLLAIFIGNLLLYTTFYIISKLLAHEKIPRLTILLIVMAAVTWAFALYFFVAHLTSWQLTPSGSREGNGECVLFEFYDKHDVWHFLSAISLFFSFLVLLTLDDELILSIKTVCFLLFRYLYFQL
ncbi:hypothetical protein DPMN_127760, partial [Dreissena polymorpha]